jgi:hypothetical protein
VRVQPRQNALWQWWHRAPNFVLYANLSMTPENRNPSQELLARELSRMSWEYVIASNMPKTSTHKSLAHQIQAWASSLTQPPTRGTSAWSPAMAWETLSAYLPTIRHLLDALLAGTVNVAEDPFLREHIDHCLFGEWLLPFLGPYLRDRGPFKTCACDGEIFWRDGREPLIIHWPECTFRTSRVILGLTVDPIDYICADIARFVKVGGAQHFGRCESCKAYFVSQTTANRLFCSSECRINSDDIRRERNRQAQRASRKGKHEEDLRRLEEAIAQLHIEEHYEIIYMSEVRRVIAMNRSKVRRKVRMTRKRVKTLRAYEFEEYGNTNITDQIEDLFTEGTNDRK